MTNQQKLSRAETQLAATNRRIRRLMHAQKNWERRVKYYRGLLESERMIAKAAERAAEIAKQNYVSEPDGRIFRRD